MNLLNLVPSPTRDSVYYLDLFEINKRVWAIGGPGGKSEAARKATDAQELGRDSIAITRVNNDLFGHQDFGAHGATAPASSPRKIDVVAYCMSDEETKKAFGLNSLQIHKVDNGIVGTMLGSSIYPGAAAEYVVSPAEWAQLNNSLRRVNKFLRLTAPPVNCEFLLIPFMPTEQDKTNLLSAMT